MDSEENLWRRLIALRDAPDGVGAPKVAVVVDFRDIVRASDPRFILSLDRHLQSWLGDHPVEVFRLRGPRLVILDPADAAPALDHAIRVLADLLHSHAFGDLRSRRYELTHAQQLRELAGDLHLPAPRSSPATLADFLRTERSLHGADVGSLVREQAIYDFTDPDDPRETMVELTVSLDEVEERLAVDIRAHPWLFEEVTEVLDTRMLRHIARDRVDTPRTFSLNLHIATVLDERFAAWVDDIPGARRNRLVVELPSGEAAVMPEAFARAVQRLRQFGFDTALDLVPLARAPQVALPPVALRFIKVLWPTGGESAMQTAGLLADAAQRFGAARTVLCRCDVKAAVDLGLAAGIGLFQGWGIDARVARILETRRSLRSVPADAPADGAVEPERKPGILRRLLRHL